MGVYVLIAITLGYLYYAQEQIRSGDMFDGWAFAFYACANVAFIWRNLARQGLIWPYHG